MTKWTNSSLQIAYYDNVLDEDGLIRIILELQAENEKLGKWLDEAQATCKALGQTADNIGAQRNSLRTEVERLKMALHNIVNISWGWDALSVDALSPEDAQIFHEAFKPLKGGE